MSTVQDTYRDRMRAGSPGLITGSDYNVDTGIVETAAGIGFGLAVSQGSGDKGIIIGGTLAGFRGITVRDVTVAPATDADEYAQYKNAGVLTRGKIWAVPSVAVAVGDPVHFNATTGALTNTGGQGPILGARWASTADADGLAIVELSGYNPN